jgi:hypothetical protein
LLGGAVNRAVIDHYDLGGDAWWYRLNGLRDHFFLVQRGYHN